MPFVESPQFVVDAMLELAGVDEDDVVYDLGSGDGRIPIAAAKTYGARGYGIEIDPALVDYSRQAAEKAGVDQLVTFITQDIFQSDVTDATVVTLYLWEEVNERLAPILEEQLRPGTRVVSHRFKVPGWREVKRVKTGGRTLYLYRMR